jgi:predicted DNA-binding antitoxin AbrB/MazE fold protein
MPWAVVRGMYEQGIVKPLESVPYGEGIEVLVLFPERIRPTGEGGIWQRIKGKMAREMPDLLSMTQGEKREEFDRLSKVIAERMPYRSLEEFERAMRGDEYGLVGY